MATLILSSVRAALNASPKLLFWAAKNHIRSDSIPESAEERIHIRPRSYVLGGSLTRGPMPSWAQETIMALGIGAPATPLLKAMLFGARPIDPLPGLRQQ